MKKIFTFLSLLSIYFFYSQTVKADNTFGNNGIYTFSNLTDGLSIINSIVQSDGKIIVAGQRINGSNNNEELFVARLNQDGTIDTSFANNGFFTDYQTEKDSYETNLFLYGNQIIIFYLTHNTLLKLNNDGTLDSTFGTNGIYTISPFDGFNSSDAYLIGNNFYVGDTTYYTPAQSGKLINFDISTQTIVSTYDLPTIANIQKVYKGPNGKLLIESNENQLYEIYLALVNSDGTIDTSFGSNGNLKVTTFPTQNDYESSHSYVAIDDNNNIIYGLSNENTSNVTVKKFDATGTLITSFATNGTYQQNNSIMTGLAILSNQIYFCGIYNNGGAFDLLVTRLNANGSLDTSFDNDGIFVYNTNSSREWAESFNIISPTSFLVVGEIQGSTNNNIYVGKFNVTPNLSTDEFKSDNRILFENPIKTKLNFSTTQKISKIELYSFEGRLVKIINHNFTDVSELEKGTYVAKVYFMNGKTVAKKLIKK